MKHAFRFHMFLGIRWLPMRKKIQKIIHKYVFLSLSGLFLWSGCTRQIQLGEGEFLLKNQRFEGNSFVSSDELQGLIPLAQKPNTRPFSFLNLPFTPKIWYLNFGKNTFNRPKQEIEKEKTKDSSSIHKRNWSISLFAAPTFFGTVANSSILDKNRDKNK